MSECQCGGANKRPPAVLSVFTVSEVTGVRRRVRSQESKSTFTLLKKEQRAELWNRRRWGRGQYTLYVCTDRGYRNQGETYLERRKQINASQTHMRTQTLNRPNLVKTQTDDVLQTPYLTHRGATGLLNKASEVMRSSKAVATMAAK